MTVPLRPITLFLLLASTVGLTACSSEDERSARIRVEPSAVDFGVVEVDSEKTRTIEVRNVSSTPVGIRLTGEPTSSPVFLFVADRTRIPPGASATIAVTFSPRTSGAVSTQLSISHDRPGLDSVRVSVTGLGYQPGWEVTPDRLDFGRVVVGSSETLTTTLRNNSMVEASIEFPDSNSTRLCDDPGPQEFCVRVLGAAVGEDRRFNLNPDEPLQLEVQFTPRVAGTRSQGSFTLKACASRTCEIRVDLDGFGVETGLRCRPSRVDFGQVNPGASSRQTVTCENVSGEPMTILGWSIVEGSDPAFTANPSRREVLDEGESIEVNVVYAPSSLGEASAVLSLEIDFEHPVLRKIAVDLVGSGGGPSISIWPPVLDFGRVALIAPARRTLLITNVGFAPLTIIDIAVDTAGSGSFSSVDAGGDVLQPGESKAVTIRFSPTAVGSVQSEIRLISNDSSQGALQAIARGEGVSLSPCSFSILPPRLDFGDVQQGRRHRRSFEVYNTGTEACLITGARVLGSSDPAFTLVDGDVHSLEIAPGARESIGVELTAALTGRLAGQVEFSISSPSRTFNTVNVLGTGVGKTPLIFPDEVRFGSVHASCTGVNRTVVIHNPGPDALQLDSVATTPPNHPAFRLAPPSPLPEAPRVLAAGESARIDVGFSATELSRYSAAIEIGASRGGAPATYTVPLAGRTTANRINTDTYRQLGTSKADVLFIVESSGSMGEEQRWLGEHIGAFLSFAEAQEIDFHLGVTTAAVEDASGRLTSSVPGTWRQSSADGPMVNRIVTPQTLPSPAAVFASNLSYPLPGGSALPETGLWAALQAFLPPALNGHNAGFLREDAFLSVVFVSDEPDQSPESVNFYINALRSVKGFHNPHLFAALGITAPFPGARCSGPGGSARSSGRYAALIEQTGGGFQSICTSDWNRSLEDLSAVAFGFKSQFSLRHPPLEDTLEVRVGGEVLPSRTASGAVNWVYLASTNSVAFAPVQTPAPGVEVRLRYQTRCE